jgi:two-component system, NarL family, nitrate/nitrite response regulator NarL
MRIILADHHTQPCWALKMLLEEQPEFEIIGEAVEGEALVVLAKTYLPDLVLVDSELPGLYIEDLIIRLHALEPPPIVVVMSSEFENSRKLLKAGADAFVSKGDEPAWLLETLQKFESRSKKNE